MTDRHELADRIPWYVNGTLAADERAELEAHLEGCEACRGLVALLSDFQQTSDPDQLTDHPQAQLLLEYAENAAALEPAVRGWIDKHVATCDPCSSAVAITRRLETLVDVPELELSPRGLLDRLWDLLRGSVLQPIPALAYLIVAAVLAYPLFGRRNQSPLRVLPPAVTLSDRLTLRSDTEQPPAVRLPSTEPQVLALHSSIDRSLLEDAVARFELTILADQQIWVRETKNGADFDDLGVLRVWLDPTALPPARRYIVRIILRKSGDLSDGDILYQSSFAASSGK